MKVTMDDSRLINTAQLINFLKGNQEVGLSLGVASIEGKYGCIEKVFKQLRYQTLRKKDKRIVLNYLRKITNYRHAQFFRLSRESLMAISPTFVITPFTKHKTKVPGSTILRLCQVHEFLMGSLRNFPLTDYRYPVFNSFIPQKSVHFRADLGINN